MHNYTSPWVTLKGQIQGQEFLSLIVEQRQVICYYQYQKKVIYMELNWILNMILVSWKIKFKAAHF